jgi:acyl-ACP thioesterase
MSEIWKKSYQIDTRAVDLFGHCRPSSLLGMLQETSAEHMWYRHCGRYHLYAEYGCLWIMTRQEYRLNRPIFQDETVTVCSSMRKPGTASVYRDFEIYASGELCGCASNEWCIIDADKRRLVKLSAIDSLAKVPTYSMSTEKLGRINPSVPLEERESRVVHYSDCDSNIHMNYTRYCDFACDAIDYANEDGWIDRFFLHFHNECRIGETVTLHSGRQEDTCWVDGTDTAQHTCFVAEMHLAPHWEGEPPVIEDPPVGLNA